MPEIKYKRILLKVSGEALAGQAHHGLDFAIINDLCRSIKECVQMGAKLVGGCCGTTPAHIEAVRNAL